jgi:DMSO/TMAO reductase YedYZ molybdopterin-dependent catalytic subunit
LANNHLTHKRAADGLLPAILGGLVAVSAAVLVRTAIGTKLLAEIVVDASTYGLQPRGFSFLLSLLGASGKPLLFITVILAQVGLYLLAWLWASSRARDGSDLLRRAAVAAVAAFAAMMVVSGALVLFTEADLGSRTSWLQYGLVAAVTSLLYAGSAGLAAVGLDAAASRESEVQPSEADTSRRAFLLRLPVLALAAGAVLVIGRKVLNSTGGGARATRNGEPTPEVTSNNDFYIVSKNLLDPHVDERDWRLRVGGSSRQLLELTYADVLARPARDQYTTLECISNEVGGDLISNALWRGFLLRDLIEEAGPLASARFVAFRCEDDYVESLPLDFAMQDGIMLVYAMNGVRLPDKHGFPLRLLSPGKYGIKHPKWITEIALIDREVFGYWEKRDWSQEARMNTSSRIDVPAPGDVIKDASFRIHGIAFAGNRGISRVQVSTDGGQSWNDAVLKPGLSPFTWVLWYYDWTKIDGLGSVDIVARATDGADDVQTPVRNPPYPAGATGYPRVSVTLRPGG